MGQAVSSLYSANADVFDAFGACREGFIAVFGIQ
jgi:hypothetical protein